VQSLWHHYDILQLILLVLHTSSRIQKINRGRAFWVSFCFLEQDLTEQWLNCRSQQKLSSGGKASPARTVAGEWSLSESQKTTTRTQQQRVHLKYSAQTNCGRISSVEIRGVTGNLGEAKDQLNVV
jgi:hypothetical protein